MKPNPVLVFTVLLFAAGCGEVYAYGFRNPWRFSFGPDGRLWAADVGQGLWEEVDWVVKGGNYGWRVREGAHCYGAPTCNATGLVDPVHEYAHDAAGGACMAVPAHPMPTDPRHLLSLTGSRVVPDVVIVDAVRAASEALALAARIDRELPATGVVLVGGATELSVDAMRAGVKP